MEEDSRLPSVAVLSYLDLYCCQPEYTSVPSAEKSQNLHDVLNQAVLLLFSHRKATQSQCRLLYAAAASETAWACYGLHALQPQRVAQETESPTQHPTLIATSTYIHPSQGHGIAPLILQSIVSRCTSEWGKSCAWGGWDGKVSRSTSKI